MQTRTIPLGEVIPQTVENKHFYTNGLSKLIPRLTLKVHTDIERCYFLWDKFSPKETLFDLWDFRYSFYEGYNCKPFFYTLYEGKKILGVLPLWYNLYDKRYEWFGGWYHEENSFFVEDLKLIDFLLAVSPSPLQLGSLKYFKELDRVGLYGALEKDNDLKYFRNIEEISTMEQFLSMLKKKRRYHLKSDHRRIVARGVQMNHIKEYSTVLLDQMFEMNKERFDGTERDTYPIKRDEESFRNIIKNAGLYNVEFFHATVPNTTAAIDVIITFNNTYYQFAGANDVEGFNGIGHYMAYYEIEDAINRGFKLIDCFQEDHTWKHRYFDSREVFKFSK